MGQYAPLILVGDRSTYEQTKKEVGTEAQFWHTNKLTKRMQLLHICLQMLKRMFIHVYTNVYIYLNICLHIFLHTFLFSFLHIFTHMCKHMFTNMFTLILTHVYIHEQYHTRAIWNFSLVHSLLVSVTGLKSGILLSKFSS